MSPMRLARIDGTGVGVTVRGWYRLITGRIRFAVRRDQIIRATVAERGSLEAAVTAREAGLGTNRGTRWPGRLRLGGFLCHGLLDRQFWAVGRCEAPTPLLVLHVSHIRARSVHGPITHALLLGDAPYMQAVLHVPDPQAAAAALNGPGAAGGTADRSV